MKAVLKVKKFGLSVVDRDQVAEGKYTSKDGKESNFVLVSTLKQVGTTVKDIANKAEKGEFPGGQVIVYSLKDKGVDLAVTNLSEEGKKLLKMQKLKSLMVASKFLKNN